MPRCAIEAGVVDIVAPAEVLPQRIAQYLRHPANMAQHAPAVEGEALSALDHVVILLRERSGNDFSLYKTNTLYRRIERRMAVHQLVTMKDYVRFLRGNPQEIDLRLAAACDALKTNPVDLLAACGAIPSTHD